MSTSSQVLEFEPALDRRGPSGDALAGWVLMTVFQASAAIFTRYCKIPATSIGFYRVMGAAVILLPLYVLLAARKRPRPWVSGGSVLAGIFLGLHLATWAWAVLNTSLANAALFIAMSPVATPLLARWVSRDRLSRGEFSGTVWVCVGMAWILGGHLVFTRNEIPGSAVAFVSMIFCSSYYVVSRRSRSKEHVALFSVPVYAVAAATQSLAALLVDGGIHLPASGAAVAAVIGIILVPTVGGHTLAMYLLRHFKAHTIALSIPVQFLLIAIAGAILFKERPNWFFYPGAIVVMLGVLMAIFAAGNAKSADHAVLTEEMGLS